MIRVLAMGLAGWSVAGALLALPVQVDVVPIESPAPGSEVTAVATLAMDVEGETLPPREVRIPGSLVLDLPARTTTRLSVEADGLWAPERVILPSEGDPNTVTLTLLPAGSIQGQLEVPRGHDPPGHLDVFFQPVDSENADWRRSEAGPQVRQPCELTRDGAFDCRVPALNLDFHLHAPGFVPRYMWNVGVKAGEAKSLGAVMLQAGASVVGRVVTAEGLPPEVGTTVVLEPAIPSAHASARTEAKLDRRGRRGLVDRRGFFQMPDVAPGSYRIHVEKSGYAPTTSEPFTVYEGRETTLSEPLVLSTPVRFELVLDPPVDPYGRAWNIDLAPVGSHERKNEPVPETGRWFKEGLSPGEYRLKIRSGSGRYEYSWWSEHIRIEPHMEPLRLDIPVLQVEGEVTLGDEPLESLVWFGGPNGGRQIRIDTNEEGFYAGYLPEAGRWRVTVVSEETGRRNLEPVEIETADGARSARVDLHLPDTRITGEVVDEDGNPIAEARVQAFQIDTLHDVNGTRTNAVGEFELRGIAEGSVALSAHEPRTGKSSSMIQVHLQEDVAPQPVRLVLEEYQEIAGRVHWQGRAVPGAQVSIIPTMPPGQGSLNSFPDLFTNADGRFSVQLPARAIGANVTILPPGFAVKILSVDLPSKDRLEIEVSQEGGTLVLMGRETSDRLPGEAGVAALLQHNGASVMTGLLSSWARFHHMPSGPEETRLPMMEPGSYTYCLPREDDPPRCDSGFLSQGGELVLGASNSSIGNPAPSTE